MGSVNFWLLLGDSPEDGYLYAVDTSCSPEECKTPHKYGIHYQTWMTHKFRGSWFVSDTATEYRYPENHPILFYNYDGNKYIYIKVMQPNFRYTNEDGSIGMMDFCEGDSIHLRVSGVVGPGYGLSWSFDSTFDATGPGVATVILVPEQMGGGFLLPEDTRAEYEKETKTIGDIRFEAAGSDSGSVKIYDTDGNLVRTIFEGNFPEGENIFQWDGKDNNGRRMPPGIYPYEILLKDKKYNGKLILQPK